MQDKDTRSQGGHLSNERRDAIRTRAREIAPKMNLGMVVGCKHLEEELKSILIPELPFNNVRMIWDLPTKLWTPDPIDILIVDSESRDPQIVPQFADASPIICLSPTTDGLERKVDKTLDSVAYSRAIYLSSSRTDQCLHSFTIEERERLLKGVECAVVEKAANDHIEEAIKRLSKSDERPLPGRFEEILTKISGYKQRAIRNYLRMAEILVDGCIEDRREIASKLYELDARFGLQEFNDNWHLFARAAERASTMDSLRKAIEDGNGSAANAYCLIVAKHALEEGARIIQMNNEIIMSRRMPISEKLTIFAKMAKHPSKLNRELQLINLFNKTARRIINSYGLVYGSAIRMPKPASYAFNQIDRTDHDGNTTQMDALLLKYIPGESMFGYAHKKRRQHQQDPATSDWPKIQEELLNQTLKAQFAVIAMGHIVAEKDPNVVDRVHTKGSEETKAHYLKRVSEKFIGHDPEIAINLDVKARLPPPAIQAYLNSHNHKGRDNLPPLQPYLAGVLWNVAPPNFHGALSHITQDDSLLAEFRRSIMEDIIPVVDIAVGLNAGLGVDLPQRNLIITQSGLSTLRDKGKVVQSDLAAIDREWIRNTPYLFEAITGWESSLITVSETIRLPEDLTLNGKIVGVSGTKLPMMHYALARFADGLPPHSKNTSHTLQGAQHQSSLSRISKRSIRNSALSPYSRRWRAQER